MATPSIDSRLVYPESNPEIAENLNRICALIDALSEVVADIDESMLYMVTFDSDGGSAVAAQFVIEGNKAVEPEDPTKEDYTFAGWFNGEEEYDFDDAVEDHLALKAVWEADETEGE